MVVTMRIVDFRERMIFSYQVEILFCKDRDLCPSYNLGKNTAFPEGLPAGSCSGNRPSKIRFGDRANPNGGGSTRH